MKQTGMKILMLLLTAGVLVYFGVQGYQYFSDPFSTTLAYPYLAEDAISVSGFVIRQEQVLDDEPGALLRLRRGEGERVSAGGTVAVVYADQASLDAQTEIDTLETRLEQLRYARDSTLGLEVSARLDRQIFEKIVAYRSSVAENRLDRAEKQGSDLRTLVLKRDYTPRDMETLEAEIQQAEERLDSLNARSANAVRRITAPLSGLYSAEVDGYETVLTPDALEELTPSRLYAIQPDSAVHSSVGKLILGDNWYYAAVVSADEGRTLQKLSGEKKSLRLRFSKGVERDFEMNLSTVSAEENGQVTVVFQSKTYLAEITLLRAQNAQIILDAVEGLRVPRSALRMVTRTEEDGSKTQVTGLYCLQGAEARFKPVEVLYTGDTFLLVRSAAPDGEERTRLRTGDEVIVQAKNLFDGKVVITST